MNNLNTTVSADRPHISFFGLRNAGKSSVVNAVTGQRPLAGLRQWAPPPTRCRRPWSCCPWARWSSSTPPAWTTRRTGRGGCIGPSRCWTRPTSPSWWWTRTAACSRTKALQKLFQERKSLPGRNQGRPAAPCTGEHQIAVSAKTGANIRRTEGSHWPPAPALSERPIVADLMPGRPRRSGHSGDSAAPKGRLILPQQQTIRDILDHRGLPWWSRIRS